MARRPSTVDGKEGGPGYIWQFLEFLGMTWPGHAKRKPKVETEAVAAPLYQPSTEEARILLNTVDALAAEGKYAEAVHTLLFRSIQDIDLKRPNKIRKSLTSREIGDLDILTPHTRDAFSFIGRVVENSFFGGLPLGREDFQSCREAYEQFTVPKAWAA